MSIKLKVRKNLHSWLVQFTGGSGSIPGCVTISRIDRNCEIFIRMKQIMGAISFSYMTLLDVSFAKKIFCEV